MWRGHCYTWSLRGGPFPPWDLELPRLCSGPVCLHPKYLRGTSMSTARVPCQNPQEGAAQTSVSPLGDKVQGPPRLPREPPGMSHWAGLGTQAPTGYVAARTLGPGRERDRKAGAQSGSASVHHQEHHQAGPAQNSSPDARKYFILLCFPTKENKHSQISMGPDSKEGEREREEAWPPTERAGFVPLAPFFRVKTLLCDMSVATPTTFPVVTGFLLVSDCPFPGVAHLRRDDTTGRLQRPCLRGISMNCLGHDSTLEGLTSDWVAGRGFLSP